MRPARSALPHYTGMSSNRQYTARHHSGLLPTNNGGPRRPPKLQQQRPSGGDSNSDKRPRRPTHFLALPIGHHPELRNAISALTSSWLAHEPPIEGLDPSIVVHPRRLHLTLGVMDLTSSSSSSPTPSSPNPNPTTSANSEQEQEQQPNRDLASAEALLASLAPRLRALLVQNTLRVPLGRLAVMQPDTARAHVLYAEPDLRSTDGRRLLAVCGAFCFCYIVFGFDGHCISCCPSLRFLSSGISRAGSWCVQGSWLSR